MSHATNRLEEGARTRVVSTLEDRVGTSKARKTSREGEATQGSAMQSKRDREFATQSMEDMKGSAPQGKEDMKVVCEELMIVDLSREIGTVSSFMTRITVARGVVRGRCLFKNEWLLAGGVPRNGGTMHDLDS